MANENSIFYTLDTEYTIKSTELDRKLMLYMNKLRNCKDFKNSILTQKKINLLYTRWENHLYSNKFYKNLQYITFNEP